MRVTRKNISQLLGRMGEHFLLAAKFTFVVLGMLFVIAASILPLRRWLVAQNIVSDDIVNDAIAVAFLLNLVLFSLVYRRLIALHKAVKPSDQGQDLIEGGVGMAYPELLKTLKAVRSQREKSLTILGLTLATAGPMLYAWKEHLRGWKINLYCLDPRSVSANSDEIPRGWANKCQSMIDDLSERANELRQMGIDLGLKTYSMFPGVFGFCVDNGDIFVGIAHWDVTPLGATLAEPVHFYECFRSGDNSARANCYRQLFGSWLSAAECHLVNRDALLPRL
jgi:hypothetical protein